MASIPLWLTGRGTSAVLARTQIPDANGLLGNGTGVVLNLTGLVDEIDLNGEDLTQEINALTATLENQVGYLIDDSWTIREIMRSGLGNQFLASLWYNADDADHVLVTVTRGGNTWTGIWVMLDYNEDITKPKSVAELIVRMVDLGNQFSNPDFSQP